MDIESSFLHKYLRYWSNKNLTLFAFFTSLITLTFSLVYLIVIIRIESSVNTPLSRAFERFLSSFVIPDLNELITDFISKIFFAPLIETFLFHFLIIIILRSFIKNITLVVMIDAVLFALGHYQRGLESIFSSFFIGIILCYSYIFWHDFKNSKSAGFRAAFEIHVFHNFWYFLLNFVPASLIF